MSKRMKVNLILLAMMVLPPLSSLLLRYEGTMAIAMTPVLGYVYLCLPFSALQVLLCCNFRGRFSRLVRLLPLVAAVPVHLLGWYLVLGVGDVAGIPGIALIVITIIPVLGFVLGWIAWAVLRRRNLF